MQAIPLLESIVESYPEAHEFLTDYFQLSRGEVEKLVTSTRKEIDRISSQPGWINSWNDEERFIPDYSEVRNRLEILDGLSGKPIIEM